MKFISCPPNATALMESTRAIGYSLQTAIADIIDNSIAANASRVEIFYSPIEKYVAIFDDGFGISADEINRAMEYGGMSPLETRDEKDLGRFGLGMKTASLSQCEILTVVSKRDNKISARRWDLNIVREKNSWTLIELSPEEISEVPKVELLENFSSGTLVVWQKLNRMFQGNENIEHTFPKKMNAVCEHLSLVFHRYLSGEEDLKKISILVNNLPVEPSDPFLRNKITQVADEISLTIDDKPKIKIIPYTLPFPSKLSKTDKKILGITADLRKNQGFYVYRNKRLIVWGTWFNRLRKEFLSQLARIQIDIPPDFDKLWVLDVKKSVAIPPPVIRENLNALIERYAARSQKTYTYRGKREINPNVPHVWNRIKVRDGGIVYEINEKHPIFLRLIEKFPACEKNFKNLLKLIASELPLNQLRLDFNSKDEIEQADLYTENNIRELLEIFTYGLSSGTTNELLDNLKRNEPYKNFPQVIEEFRRSEEHD